MLLGNVCNLLGTESIFIINTRHLFVLNVVIFQHFLDAGQVYRVSLGKMTLTF